LVLAAHIRELELIVAGARLLSCSGTRQCEHRAILQKRIIGIIEQRAIGEVVGLQQLAPAHCDAGFLAPLHERLL
jgi:hypothetical protein